jgi:hypothetical protein
MKVMMHSSSSNSSEDSSTSPTRPLTAYHLFFQLEREFILQTTRDDDAPTTMKDDDHRPLGKDLDVDMPFRYRYIHLSPEWCISGKLKKKRIHRKTHGKISFQDLSTAIASQWKELETTDNSTYLYVRKVAARELSKYREIKKANATAALYKLASASIINMKNNSKVEKQQLLCGNELKSSGGSSSSSDASSGIDMMMANDARSSPVLSGGSANSEQRRVSQHSSISTITSSSSSYTNTHQPAGVVQRGGSFFTSGAKRNSFINDAFVSSGGNYMQQQQQQRHSCPPTYGFHYNQQLKELQSDINAFMTRMGPRMMEEEQSQRQKANEVNMNMITPTDDIKPTDYNRKASVELSLDDAMELYKALSSDDGEQTTPMYSQSVRRASAA